MSAVSPTAAARQTPAAVSTGPAHNLREVLLAIEQQRGQPIVSLRDALLQLRLLDGLTIDALQREDPSLLRSRSAELVQRRLLTEGEWHRALARVAGLVEVEVLGFEVERDAFEMVSLRQARDLQVVPLGLTEER